ncbi:MAG TPA: IS3 family transposase, partial [Kineosporiaceae bacterium]|nr:IS3 family transposase [Kineosporiaceae bacterium]
MTRFTFVDREKALYAVAVLCRLLKISRAGYYAWVARPPSAREVADGVLTTQIQNAFDSHRRVYGSPRIHAELADADVHVGRKRVARLMREAGIVGLPPLQAQGRDHQTEPQRRSGAGPRPWIAIGAWVLLSVLVVAASAGFGKQLDDSLAAPGTDSKAAADLLAGADSGAGGLTAYVVATSSQDGETIVDSRQARVDLDQLESAMGDLPKVLGTTAEVSPDGRVALLRVQYPEIGELAVSDLDALKAVVAESRASSSLRLEAGGDLYFSFEQPPASRRRHHRTPRRPGRWTGCAARCCLPRWRPARRPRTSVATPPPCPTSASA